MKKAITTQQIRNFRTYLIREEKSKATVEKYVRDITALMAWLKGREADKTAVLDYKISLTDTYSAASVNSMISSMNSFFDFCGWQELKVKLLKIQKPIFADESKELKPKECVRLLKAAKDSPNERLYLIIQAICLTGIRVSELRFITVEAVCAKQAKIQCKAKERIILLPNELCRLLQIYIKKQGLESGSVFITQTGKPMDRSNIWAEMKKLCELAGVDKDKVFPHNFRHLFARTFYAIDKDIAHLADILGHTSINTTRIYLLESGETHRKQIEKMHLLRC